MKTSPKKSKEKFQDKTWSVFDCDSYQEIVDGLFSQLVGRDAKPKSIRAIAKILHHASPGAIHAMRSGSRLLSAPVLARLTDVLGLTARETRFVADWLEFERADRAGTASDADRVRLAKKNLHRGVQETMTSDAFAYLADWYHLPLKALIGLPGFKFNLDWIEERLKHKVTSAQTLGGLGVMEHLGLIERKGRTWVVCKEIATQLDIPSEAVRKHHVQMMGRASEAVADESISTRDMSSTTFAFDLGRIEEAKAMIEEFRREFLQRFETFDCGEVCQLNLQLFPHTRPVDSGNRLN